MGCYKRSVLGQEDHKHKGAALRLLGDAVIQFDNCALRYNSTRNELASSCKIYASDLIVEGSRITVAQILDVVVVAMVLRRADIYDGELRPSLIKQDETQ